MANAPVDSNIEDSEDIIKTFTLPLPGTSFQHRTKCSKDVFWMYLLLSGIIAALVVMRIPSCNSLASSHETTTNCTCSAEALLGNIFILYGYCDMRLDIILDFGYCYIMV